ncbi:MAG: SLC13 family permease [Pseudomonadota bacterium]
MTADMMMLFGILACTLFLFAWGRWRYDMVAILALVTSVLVGLVPPVDAFSGFGHPAIITVAAVLIISKALQNSGVVTWLSQLLAKSRRTTVQQISATSGLVALLSCIMNNVGALAIMMPVTLRNARKAKRSPSVVLMPLSFASLLGGLVTLIGTPTNIVISSYRQEFTGEAYSMFDFAPVGAMVAVAGLAYLALIGWRLLPERVPAMRDSGMFHVEDYVSELVIPEGSNLIGKQVRFLERECENEVAVMTIIRRGNKRQAPRGIERFQQGDVLIVEGDPSLFSSMMGNGDLVQAEAGGPDPLEFSTNGVRVAEVVLLPNSPIEGQSMRGLRMHDRYGINLLAISRRGERPVTRLAKTRFQTGDVLLLQGEATALEEVYAQLGLLEVAERGLEVPKRRTFLLPLGIFGSAIILTALGLVPVTIAFVSAVIAMIGLGLINSREVYDSIEWPIIVLLGALIPVGQALQTTGGTELIAVSLVEAMDGMPVWFVITALMVISMWLSDIIPNTPVAVLMAPIGFSIASQLGLAADPFLMAVAIGCATPFLTPIGHQSNTLVMGSGGYRFFDYARMGIGLELIVVAVAVPMILLVWPV